MKTKSKSKSYASKPDNQLTLDNLDQKIGHLTDIVLRQGDRINILQRNDAALLSLRQQNDERAYTQALTPAPKPTLKWFEQAPQLIEWCVCCDPARLVLMPGTTLRYSIEDAVITTYDGVTIGELNSVGHNIICDAVKQGDKVHVYLTTARRLGIKLGRPA